MGSVYLQQGEYKAFGVNGCDPPDIAEASLYIDGWLRRPEGLIWSPDAGGNPAYMSALTPSYTLTTSAALTVGQNKTVPVSGPLLNVQPGDALILDRANTNVTEAVVVMAKTGNVLTLGNVAYAHSSGALLEAGLGIIERKYTPKNRPIIQLKRAPVQRILSGKGRYAYSRRGDAPAGNTDDFNLLAVYSQFGGPPAWEVFNTTTTEVDPRTGECWIPAGIMLDYYSEVEVTYVAGFSAATLPDQIKQVCAMLVRTLANDDDLGPVKSYRAGDTAIEKFADSNISGDMALLLKPYRALPIA